MLTSLHAQPSQSATLQDRRLDVKAFDLTSCQHLNFTDFTLLSESDNREALERERGETERQTERRRVEGETNNESKRERERESKVESWMDTIPTPNIIDLLILK